MKKFVWDTSALINIKEPDENGYSPGNSLMKDLSDGWITGPYENIFPAIAVFEVNATVSRMHREKKKIMREYYVLDRNSRIYPIDDELISKCTEIVNENGFSSLRGADLIFACIAYLEDAFLVTKDKDFSAISSQVRVIDLNISINSASYRDQITNHTNEP
jgi:predicted nucleic acid-binding protein